jgi:peptide deformylase
MQQTVKHAKGAGLAAPQVDLSVRVCLALINGKMIPLINPTITKKSAEKDSIVEACLSLPGIDVPVERPVQISIQYLDDKG